MVLADLATKARNQSGRRDSSFHTKGGSLVAVTILLFGTVTSLLTGLIIQQRLAPSIGREDLGQLFPNGQHADGWLCLTGLYSSPTCDTLYLSLTDVPRWGTWWDSRGMKITTFLVLILLARKELLGLPHTNLGKRTIAPDLVQRSLGTAVIFQLTFILGLFGLCLVTPDGQRFLYLVFEVVSALATVGVTANVTSTLNGAGLGIIMVLMFIGRIGPLTLMVSLNNYKAKKADALQYAKADIIIG